MATLLAGTLDSKLNTKAPIFKAQNTLVTNSNKIFVPLNVVHS